MTQSIDLSALEPLFAPNEEPQKHRAKSKDGGPAKIIQGRRPSPIALAQNLRGELSQWRLSDYPGVSDTTRELLYHWFKREHRLTSPNGEAFPFSYYFCQREALETMIFLREVREITSLSDLIAQYGPGSEEERTMSALGISPEEDRWPRYAFKVATGAGKTKIMSLAIVWSYFHSLKEPDSQMAKHFVLIAPNIIVFERLKEDFADSKVFYNDPLIPPAWKDDFNLSVVLQDEASGSSPGGVLYLTNIHRLYDNSKRRRSRDEETYDWMGPAVSKQKALDTSETLRQKITSHPKILVLNDEAHHVWDPDSTWNECIDFLTGTIQQRTGNNLVAQLDFSATPKDNAGNLFRHIVCDAPLGEAIDAGIVKTPIIGESSNLQQQSGDNAAVRYFHHLLLGYNRWHESHQEWQKSGKKAIMFVMTEDADAADQIFQELNTNPAFKELNSKTLNLHTRLKGKYNKRRKQWEQSDKDITDEDLQFLRQLASELDKNSSPYRCIVSVLMLREGWDVRNVTTIVPLRSFTSKAAILPEQTLGRGLRRMTPPGQAHEIVTIVEHPEFAKLYKGELAQQGVDIEVVDVDKVPKTTVTIYPDSENKDLEKLKLLIPTLTPGFRRTPKLENLTLEDIKQAFSKYKPLPIGEKTNATISYKGKHLITDEIVQQMDIQLPLFEVPGGCISFYRTELERQTRVPGLKHVLDSLLEEFIQNVLFEKPVSVFDSALFQRFSEPDVREYIRATFVPLILDRTTFKEERKTTEQLLNITLWKPFQATHSNSRPVLTAAKTPFNLVTCGNQFEAALAQLLDKMADVVAFCKNAGPQALRIDYLNTSGQLALYTPDFIARTKSGTYYLIEAKGRQDFDVPLKARAAVEWCKSATTKANPWEYLYITEALFNTFSKDNLAALARTSAPALAELTGEAEHQQIKITFFMQKAAQETKKSAIEVFITDVKLNSLPSSFKMSIEQSVELFLFCEKREGFSFANVFTPLLKPLDSSSHSLIYNTLIDYVPTNPYDQRDFFDVAKGTKLDQPAQNLKKTLVYKSGFSPIGLLKFCLSFDNSRDKLPGIFDLVAKHFKPYRDTDLLEQIDEVNKFRNEYVAHQERVLTDPKHARVNLKHWIDTIVLLNDHVKASIK